MMHYLISHQHCVCVAILVNFSSRRALILILELQYTNIVVDAILFLAEVCLRS